MFYGETFSAILSARCCIVIQLKNICKSYRIGPNKFQALNSVDLTIEKGEFVSVCGPSGSGKTTLLNMIGCLDTFEAGQYLLNGTDVSKMNDKKRSDIRNACIGFVLQDFALINAQTVLYNVMLPLLFSKCPYRQIKKKALAALNSVHILDQAHKKVNQLSGGQRQRVAIARAIVNHPEIILADEPTGQLDSETSRQIMELLTELNQRGITVVVVTHDPIVAASASRKITVIDGRITSDTLGIPL